MKEKKKTAELSKVVVVTGSIGSGKSTVTAILESLGATTICADTLARQVVVPGSSTLQEIVSAFGTQILATDGSLNREQLADIVFSSKEDLEKLESILHPEIQVECEKQIIAAQHSGATLVVYDCPLYFEAGLEDRGFAAVLLVTSSPEIALSRVTERDDSSKSEVSKRQLVQMADDEKRAGADFVIENDGTLEQLRKKVEAIAPKLFAL